MSSALSLFDINLTLDLKDECGDAAKGTWDFFEFFNDHITQSLLTVSTSKGIKMREASTFTFAEDIRLKCFREISDWIINDWCPHVK